MPSLPEPFRTLARHFFGRFFENDFLSRDGEVRLTVTHIISLLAVPGTFISLYLAPKYVRMAFLPPAVLERMLPRELASDRLMFVYLTMTAIGFITVLEWDALFPDRRDYVVLTALPIRLRSLFAAKLAALFAFLGIFCFALNATSTVFFPFAALGPRDSFGHVLCWIGVHFLMVMGSGAFVFCSLVALQGLLLILLSYRVYRRLALYFQAAAMFLLLGALLLFPRITGMLHPLKDSGNPLLYAAPPAWFLGLYETLLGSRDPVWRALGTRALWGLAAAVGGMLLAYAAGYRFHVRKSLEALESAAISRSAAGQFLARVLDRTVLRQGAERAVFWFIVQTLMRSRGHRLILATYTGAGFALALEGLWALLARHNFSGPRGASALLSIPLVLSFFLLSGMRVVFSIPAELRANWAFRMAEPPEMGGTLAGVRKAMLLAGVAPLLLAGTPFYVIWGGWRTALLHGVFTLALCVLLTELLLMNFIKIPFTCSYVPGKAKLPMLWVFYWTGFAIYAYTMAELEVRLLQDFLRFGVFIGLIAAAVAGLGWYRRTTSEEGLNLVFDEQPEPAVRVLNLSQ